MSNPIATENLLAGTSNWRISQISNAQIQIYADQLTLDPGSTINFFVSTQVASTGYTLNIFRLGSYTGNQGGCLKYTASGRVGVAQGYWDESGQTLNNCPTAVIDSTTHRVEAGWTITDSWTVPIGSVTGVYMAQVTDANGYQTAITFVVRGNATADFAYVRAETTDQAYNDWGGYSLYSTTPATKVSFNRPNVQFGGTGGLLGHEMAGIRWFESMGYNISYLSILDVHTNPAQLLNYKAVLFGGHSEYWTREMRDGVEASIAAGVGLGIVGANDCYWQVRFEPDSTGNANRTVTCYKVGSADNPAHNLLYASDPFYGVDNTRVTTTWRDALINRPEWTFIGPQYVYGNHFAGFEIYNVAWIVGSGAGSNPLIANTGLVAGSSYGIDGVGYEFDGTSGVGSPGNLQIIGTTPVTQQSGSASVSNTTIYQASSGAWVFASGAINFVNMLDTYRWTTPTQSGGRVSPPVQRFMQNVLYALQLNKSTKAFSSLGFHG